MKFFPFAAAVPAFLLLGGCASSIVTNHVARSVSPMAAGEGIHYFLPKTIIHTVVPVTEEKKKPGAYADLALLFFPMADPKTVVTTESASYSIDPSQVTIATRGIKDLDQEYVLRPRGQLLADTKFHFTMNDQGVPTQISAEIDDKTIDVAFSVLENAATLTAKAVGGGLAKMDANAAAKTAGQPPSDCPNAVEFPAGNPYAQLSPPLDALYCYLYPGDRAAVFTGNRDYAEVLAQYLGAELAQTPPPLRTAAVHAKVARFLDARSLFVEFLELANAGSTLITRDIGQTSDTTLKAVLDARAARMKEILGKFFGTKEKDPAFWSGVFDFDPVAADVSHAQPLFTFDKDRGICSATDTATVRLVSARPELVVGLAVCSPVTLTLIADGAIAASGTANAPSESGLRYRMPRSALVQLSSGTAELARQQVAIAQFGQIASLPKRMGATKSQYDVTFDGASGALLDITVGSSAAIDSSLVKRAAGIADTGIGLQQTLDKAAEAPSEQAKAEKERKLKEEKLKILLLQNCLVDPTLTGCTDLVKLP